MTPLEDRVVKLENQVAKITRDIQVTSMFHVGSEVDFLKEALDHLRYELLQLAAKVDK